MQVIEDEKWLDVKGYENGYQVSNTGQVKSLKSNKILKPSKNSLGYRTVSLCSNTQKKTFSIHTLVWRTFQSSEVVAGYVVDHKDNDKANNSLDNLQYITCRENSLKNPPGQRIGKTSSEMQRSAFAGTFHKKSQKWAAYKRINGKATYLGLYETKEQANQAYQKAK